MCDQHAEDADRVINIVLQLCI